MAIANQNLLSAKHKSSIAALGNHLLQYPKWSHATWRNNKHNIVNQIPQNCRPQRLERTIAGEWVQGRGPSPSSSRLSRLTTRRRGRILLEEPCCKVELCCTTPSSSQSCGLDWRATVAWELKRDRGSKREGYMSDWVGKTELKHVHTVWNKDEDTKADQANPYFCVGGRPTGWLSMERMASS